MVFPKQHISMRSGSGLLCVVALMSTVGVVVCTKDFRGVKSGWRSKHMHVVSGLRKMLQSDGLDEALLGAATVGDATSVQRLLDAGANPNTLHEKGIVTPLTRASSRGHIDVVRTLLNAGVDVNFANTEGNTALHFAAWNGYPNIVGLLLENGADPKSENKRGWTPLLHASRYGHPEALEKLISFGGDISHQDQDGWAPLHFAARFRHLAVVNLLLQKGANLELETFEFRSTPMNLAAIAGSGIIIQNLIDAGADKDHRISGSYTPLIHAAYWGHQEAIEVLVENGADKSVVGENGLNAKENVCLCTTASEVDPVCEVEACEEPGRMERLLDP